MSEEDLAPATATMLVEKLLRLERPQITEQMAPLLLSENSIDIFLSHLLSPSDHEQSSIRNSYWVAKLLSEDVVGAKILEDAYNKEFISTLLGCFRQGVKCWMPHICTLLSAMLRGKADQVTQVFTSSTSACLVHFTALCEFSDVDLVSGLIQDIVCLPAPLPGHAAISCSSELQQLLNQRLAECDLWYFFSSMIVNNDLLLARSIAAADCFICSLKRTAVSSHSSPLATSLAESAERIIDQLIAFTHEALVRSRETPVDSSTVTRFGMCTNVLLALLERTMPATIEAPSSNAYQSFGGTVMMCVPNMLHAAFPIALVKLVELRTHVFDLLRMTMATDENPENTAVKHTGYVTASPFTLARLNLVRILHIMLAPIVEVEVPANMIEEVPDSLWRLFGSWFCAYPHSNLYHHVYVQIFSHVLSSGCEKAVKGIIKRAKKKRKKADIGFLSRIMRHYGDGDANSSVRGHILHCLNIVRLRAQLATPTSALNSYLRDLQEWREFQPTLEEETIRTVAQQKYAVPQKYGEIPKSDFGIHLGSPYAVSLGFDVHVKNKGVVDEDQSNQMEEANKS